MTEINSSKCSTCNLSSELLAMVHKWNQDEGLGARNISKRLEREYSIKIGKSAVGNHLTWHKGPPEKPKAKVWYMGTPPEGTDHSKNDLWFNMKDSNRPMRWDGAEWVSATDTKPAVAEPTPQTLLGVGTPVKAPKGWEASVDFNEDTGTGEVTSTPQLNDKLTDFSQVLEEFNIDPEKFEVDGGVRLSKWQMFSRNLKNEDGSEGGLIWLTAYKFRIRRKVISSAEIEELVSIVKDVKPHVERPNGDYTFVFAAGDLQLGKSDTDGTEGIVKRYRESLQIAVNKAQMLDDFFGPILISWVGDCIEGMVSQGGKNARRTELTTTQQVRLLRLLMTETIKAFAPLTNDLTVVSVPGNHDEAQRMPVTTDPSDSWAVDALVAVSEALEFNPEAFGHVKCLVVPFDEMTTTVTTSGTTITHAHGHQWSRGKHWDWWSGQHWGSHDPGKADILLCGHLHTGVYEQQNFKHFIRTPSFEKESTYFRHRTGLVGNPSAVTFLTKDGKIKFMDFE